MEDNFNKIRGLFDRPLTPEEEAQLLSPPTNISSTQAIKLTPPEQVGYNKGLTQNEPLIQEQTGEVVSEEESPSSHTPVDEGRQLSAAATKRLPVSVVSATPGNIPGLIKPKSQNEDVLARYREAAAKGDAINLISMLGKAGSQMGAGIAGGVGPGLAGSAPKMDVSVYDDIAKMSKQPVEQFLVEKQIKEEAEKRDPNSAYSLMMKNLLVNKLGMKPETVEGLPGHELDKVFGNIVKIKGIEETAANRKLVQGNLEAQREYMRNLAQNKFDELKNERTNKQIDNFVKYIDPTQKAGGAFAGYQKTIDAANRLKPILYTETGEIANPNKQMMEEIAIAVNTLIAGSGGSRSRAQIESLMPHTFKGDLRKLQEWLVNDPTGLDQQSFVKQFAKLVNREESVAKGSIVKEIEKRADSLRPRIRDKDTFDQAVELRKAEYTLPTQGPNKQKEQITLPKGHSLTPGKKFQERSTGKTFKVNDDGQTASEI